MRWIVLIGAVGLLGTQAPTIQTHVDDWFGPREDPRSRAAIEIECRNTPVALRDDCERELRREFESGVRQPRSIVQRHCTRFASEWPRERQAPPTVCTELFGGWIES